MNWSKKAVGGALFGAAACSVCLVPFILPLMAGFGGGVCRFGDDCHGRSVARLLAEKR